MPAVALLLLLVASAAHADLYRWVDPETGSVKLSNTPPPWIDSDRGPKVERIAAPLPPPPVVAKPTPAAPKPEPKKQ